MQGREQKLPAVIAALDFEDRLLHNHVINSSETTGSTFARLRYRDGRQARHGTRIPKSRGIEMPIYGNMWHGLTPHARTDAFQAL